MAILEPLRVIHADIMEGGALIGFSDGTTAVYSAELLQSILAQAAYVEPNDLEDK